MFNKEFKEKAASELLIFLGLLALALLITRMWPLLLLVVIGILITALWRRKARARKAEIMQPAIIPSQPESESERDILRRAFGLIQRRVTEEVERLHPSARWQWLTPNAMATIGKDEPVSIILNGAGGYRKAVVSVRNLVFTGLVFETAANPLASRPDPDDDDPETDGSDTAVNYEYLAFEWADAHLLRLNERGNEALAQGQNTFLIPADELPERDGWSDLCRLLTAGDFAEATVIDGGIRVRLRQ